MPSTDSRYYERTRARLANAADWPDEALSAELAPYTSAHGRIVLTPEARRPSMAVVRRTVPQGPDGAGTWEARQRILDPDGEADWMLDCVAELPPGPLADAPLLQLRRIGV